MGSCPTVDYRWSATQARVLEPHTVFLDDLGEFRTTRAGIEAAQRVHRELPLSDHLEIETYTWDVLPDSLKNGDITDYISRELDG